MSELWKWPAHAIAAAVTSGEASAREVVDSHLQRIAQVNPRVNAITQLLADSAREQAAAIDARRAQGHALGPLAGVPFSVKENIAIAGVPTTQGIKHFRGLVARRDAPPVARLRAADAIVLGHSNMVDLALGGAHTDSELYGATINPWDPALSPGGTSGGDGVAVASGMVPLGLGNDSGGSIRIPAAFGGVAALKPSYGRFAADHRIGPDEPTFAPQLITVDGPIARSVADLRAVYAVLAGADPRDPRALPLPLEGPPLHKPLKVAMVMDPGGRGVDPAVRAALLRAAAALQDADYEVAPVQDLPRFEDALSAYTQMLMTEFSLVWPRIKHLLRESSRSHMELSMRETPALDLAGYIQIGARRLGIQRAWADFFLEYPIVLGPVFTEPGMAVGLDTRDMASHARVVSAMRLCSVTSFLGVPAVVTHASVYERQPQGVQLIASMYREDLCLGAARAIEERIGVPAPVDPAEPPKAMRLP